jgi:hypothetical protein
MAVFQSMRFYNPKKSVTPPRQSDGKPARGIGPYIKHRADDPRHLPALEQAALTTRKQRCAQPTA